jgi:hypothetical protein
LCQKANDVTEQVVSFIKCSNLSRAEVEAVCYKILFDCLKAKEVKITVKTYAEYWQEKKRGK